MKESVKLALRYVPYTCPTLDSMAQDLIDQLPEKYSKDILEFVENIKKDITCPMRTALEQVCEELIEVRSQNETLMYDQSINHE